MKFYYTTRSLAIVREFGDYAELVYEVADGNPLDYKFYYRVLIAEKDADGQITLYRYPGIISTVDELKSVVMEFDFTFQVFDEFGGCYNWPGFIHTLTGGPEDQSDNVFANAKWTDAPEPVTGAETEGDSEHAESDAN